MCKVVVRPLRPYEKKKLRRMKRQRANAVNCRHARIILLSRGRVPNREIAARVDCTPTWVRHIIHRFNENGVRAIVWYPWWQTRDTPRKFAADVREQIAEVASSPPKELIGMTQWSLPKLRDYLVEQKIVASISVEWLRQCLHRWKIRLRRTKTWKESNDPDFARKYRAIRRLYQKRPAGGRRLCLDEFGPLNLQPRHGCCYAALAGSNVCAPPITARAASAISWPATTWRRIGCLANSRTSRRGCNGWLSSNRCGAVTPLGRCCTSSWTITVPTSRPRSCRGR